MTNSAGQPLIHLDGVTKVFFTDEVETHALAGIHLEIRSGEYIAIAGPSGCRAKVSARISDAQNSPARAFIATATTPPSDSPQTWARLIPRAVSADRIAAA